MVPVDFPKIKSWPVIEFRMEIFIADQHVQFVTGNCDGDISVAFLVSNKIQKQNNRQIDLKY